MIPLPQKKRMDCPFIDIHTHTPRPESKAIVNMERVAERLPDENRSHSYSYGIHPWWFDDTPTETFLCQQLSILEQLLHEHRLLAIGETGIDKLHPDTLPLQTKAFEQQILLSEKHRLPLIIHNVKGTQEIVHLHSKLHPKQPWILHGFNGNSEEVFQLAQKGFYFSIGEGILHKNRKITNSIQSIPWDHLFFETDTSTCSIEAVYQKAGELLGISLDFLKERVFANAADCFGNGCFGSLTEPW